MRCYGLFHANPPYFAAIDRILPLEIAPHRRPLSRPRCSSALACKRNSANVQGSPGYTRRRLFRALAKDVQTEMTTSSRADVSDQRAVFPAHHHRSGIGRFVSARGRNTDGCSGKTKAGASGSGNATAAESQTEGQARRACGTGFPNGRRSGQRRRARSGQRRRSPPTAGAKPEDGAKPDAAAKPAAEAAPKPPAWSEAEIADARAHCAVVLKRIHAVVLPHEPIKEGACGTPAPIELISIGAESPGRVIAARDRDVRSGRSARRLVRTRRPAARTQAPQVRDHQDRDDEFLLVPQRLRPQEDEAQRTWLWRTRSISAAS